MILPTHKLLDRAYENAKGDAKIGSTLRGIGPAYEGKVSRNGFRVGDILTDDFKTKYQKIADSHKVILETYNTDIKELEENTENYRGTLEQAKSFIEIMKDSTELEKFAREKYYLKKENEDIFIIEHEDSIKAQSKNE